MPYIPDYPCRMSIIRGSRSGKTNALFIIIREKYRDVLIDKAY